MEFQTFQESIKSTLPPAGISLYLQAMWYDAQGDWSKAHDMVDSLSDTTGCWVHAYLHCKEGDTWNAGYWYSKAGKKPADVSLQEEWETIVRSLL